MLPSADTHVHLLAGLDDGPRSLDEALAMCRMLAAEGVGLAAALAHQNPDFPANDAARIREAAASLAVELAARRIPLSVHPTGEAMLGPDTLADWKAGRLQSVGGHGQALLAEMPHGIFLDVAELAKEFRALGVRLVIAHAERYPELLHDPGLTAKFVAAGCLIQVTASAIADPPSAADEAALKSWARRGILHVLGSDGHNLDRRPPRIKAGVARLAKWAGAAAADRVAGIWGAALVRGTPLNPPAPLPPPRGWFGRLFG